MFFKHFSNETFKKSLLNKPSNKVFITKNDCLQILLYILNKKESRKEKHVRGNQIPFKRSL